MFLIYPELGEVNRRLPETERINDYWWYPGKMSEIRQHYERFYPGGRIDLWRRVLTRVAMVFMLIALAFADFFDLWLKPR
jgi:hypothetical protein